MVLLCCLPFDPNVISDVHSQVWDAWVAGFLELISEELAVLPWSGQLLQVLHLAGRDLVTLGEALLESSYGGMSQPVEDGEECAVVVESVEMLRGGWEGGRRGREGEKKESIRQNETQTQQTHFCNKHKVSYSPSSLLNIL